MHSYFVSLLNIKFLFLCHEKKFQKVIFIVLLKNLSTLYPGYALKNDFSYKEFSAAFYHLKLLKSFLLIPISGILRCFLGTHKKKAALVLLLFHRDRGVIGTVLMLHHTNVFRSTNKS